MANNLRMSKGQDNIDKTRKNKTNTMAYIKSEPCVINRGLSGKLNMIVLHGFSQLFIAGGKPVGK